MDISRNKNLVYGAAIAMATVGIGWQNLSQPPGQSPGDVARSVRRNTQLQEAKLKGSEEAEAMAQQTADTRYRMGCLMPVAISDPSKYAALSTDPVLDSTTKRPVTRGTRLCDANGNTGIADENGIPQNLAFTGNREVVQKRMQQNHQSGIPAATQTAPQQGVKNDRSATR